jgi:hypothetical protein
MLVLRAWSRGLVVAMLVMISSPYALAQRSATKLPTQTTETTPSDTPREQRERVGDPILGVLIIVGVVGLLIFIAWVFSRIGEGGSRQSDGTMN